MFLREEKLLNTTNVNTGATHFLNLYDIILVDDDDIMLLS